ncbi:MAG: potassium channel family protein [Candidatus Thiodiazotropha taylori]|nr:potassium channel family protein [Candidatus Thiodiazotropha taylori]
MFWKKELISRRERIYNSLHVDESSGKIPILVRLISFLIIFSVIIAIIGTDKQISKQYESELYAIDFAIFILLFLELFTRYLTCGTDSRYTGFKGHLRYIILPHNVIDLIVLVPFLLGLFIDDLLILRISRLLRIFVLAKLPSVRRGIRRLVQAAYHIKDELIVSFGVMGLVTILASTLLYFAERDIQPEVFGSIPQSLWWGIISLTTVGYGDAFPVTAIGKIIASIFSLLAVALVAIPTGLLASAFSKDSNK